jgi:hypothetical protein
MAKPIEQVEQDLNQLRTVSSEMGRELTAAYRSYFAALAPTLSQQAIQGCYHLCTNFYPEAFLTLNYDRRSQLLRTLQRTISNTIGNLAIHIDPSQRPSNNADEDDDEPTGDLTAMPATQIDWFANPSSLSTWHQNLEAEINRSLKEISYKVNVLLQQAQIIPANIPKPILEAYPEADRGGGNTANVPNLLSVAIGQNHAQLEEEEEELELETQPGNLTDRADRDDRLQIIQIHTLFLRLTEVEFSNVTALSLRKNISQLSNNVKMLKREYLQKQQELKIAEAESAWRNSWFESPS